MDLSTERQKIILKTLDHYGKVSVNELAEKFNVASATIRRDLTFLEKENKLQRVHGGAIKISFYAEEPAITKRRSMYMIEKIKIAKIASKMIEDKMSVFIDVGTTTAQIIPFLKERRNLQVLTNSLEALMELVKMVNNNTFHGKIIFIGGEINAKQLTVSGSLSEAFINQFFVDIAFIGVGGVHLSGGLTGYDEKEIMLSQQMIRNAKESVAVLDHSKIGVRNLYKIVDLHEMDRIICDKKHPEGWEKLLQKYNIEWLNY